MNRCYEPQEIATILARETMDPGRRHLEDCPRCRALALAYREFMQPSSTADLDLRATDAQLQHRLAKATAPRHRDTRSRWGFAWPQPAWRAAAAVLAVAAFGLLARDLGIRRGGDLPAGTGAVRGEQAIVELRLEQGPQNLVASWPAAEASDKAMVIFYDTELKEVARVLTAETRLVVGPDDPGAGAAYGQLLRLADEDTLSRGAIVAIQPAED